MRIRRGLWVAAIGLIACGDKASSPGASSATAVTAGSTTATSAKAIASASGAPAQGGGDASGFSLVATSEAMAIFPLGDAALLDTGAFVALLGDKPLEQDPALTKTSLTSDSGGVTVTDAVFFDSFSGSWPGAVFATTSAQPGTFTRVNDTWTKQDPLRDEERLLSIAAWDGRALAAIRMSEPDVRFQVLGKAGGVTPGPGKPTADQDGCNVRFTADAPFLLAGTAQGQLFAAGHECKTQKAIVERWKPKEVRGEAQPLDGVDASAEPSALAAASADEAYAVFSSGDDAKLAS
jgi:hypothetical protein